MLLSMSGIDFWWHPLDDHKLKIHFVDNLLLFHELLRLHNENPLQYSTDQRQLQPQSFNDP